MNYRQLMVLTNLNIRTGIATSQHLIMRAGFIGSYDIISKIGIKQRCVRSALCDARKSIA